VAASIELSCLNTAFNPDEITCNAAVSACDKRRAVSAGIELVCPDASLDPDVVTCNAAVSAGDKRVQWQQALKSFAQMPSSIQR